MPTRPAQILELLQAKQSDFQNFDSQTVQVLEQYRQQLEVLHDPALQNKPEMVEPLDLAQNGVIPSQLCWSSREESLAWVKEQLTGVTTFSVDGSQIYPSKDISIPIALVQVGWFENPHQVDCGYEKDVRLDILTPNDLKDLKGDLADRQVNKRRFQMETERLAEYMHDHAGDRRCLVLMDGSLVATFSDAFDQDTQAFYINCLLNLLEASESSQVPLVAYVDTSYARDLTQMLQRWFQLPDISSIHDAQIIQRFMQWGDRTPLFRCCREVLAKHYRQYRDRIGFLYLKTHEGYPARLEIPLWLYENKRFEAVVNWVRSEVIIGSGYPYAIETADQVAVLQTEDRQTFYRIFQDWAEQADLNLRLSRKMVSKMRRRY